ncbi:MAG: hypothetical protein LBG64_02335 [Pseudomonadales bacterium]|jgi:hypothetical protein|nr:hypothetical protein [Pseudomonadales bacterium]
MLTAVLIWLSLLVINPVWAQESEFFDYNRTLEVYNAVRRVYLDRRASYNNNPTLANLENLLEPTVELMYNRNQVMIAYIVWMEALIVRHPFDNEPLAQEFLVRSQGFRDEFVNHGEGLISVVDTVSWYRADDNYGDIKRRFDAFAFQVFAQIFDGQLRRNLSTLEYLHVTQHDAIIAQAPNQVMAATFRNNLQSIERELGEMQDAHEELFTNLNNIGSRAAFDDYMLQANLILTQLDRNARLFDSLWQR